MNLLDPLGVRLTGSTLIEASAGTGKTYTITTLFLRLLLEKKVSIDQILVVTFTIAATEELKIKLSSRLHLANRWLRHPDTVDADKDPTLATLIAQQDPQQAQELVGDAVARLDDLSVYTIDAMCLRILQDFAFESGLPMRIEMIADDTDIRNKVARDYWRTVLGSGDDFQIQNLLSLANSPEGLLSKLNDVLRRREVELVPTYNTERIRQLTSDVADQYRDIRDCWKNNNRRIQEVFDDELDALNKTSYKAAAKTRVIDWFKKQDENLPSALVDKFHLITASNLADKTKNNKVTPQHRFFVLCDGFEERFKEYKKWQKIAAISAARDYLITATDRYKIERGMIHFEDMRTRLDNVLKSTDGAVLAQQIRSLWPFALIDEFQDTDAEQFRIFNAIYAARPDCGFFMIGDPKQAVYSWRGADVFTYMEAARQTQNSYTLGTNWRSSPAMVKAVNRIFENSADPFIFEQIPFHPVTAARTNGELELTRGAEEVAPLRFCVFESANNEEIAIACASDVAQLLIEGRDATATIAGKSVSPADVAILVRSHGEASLMQNALRRFGVRSVSMPNQSVFQSNEALELYQVLHAMAYPGQETELRAALVTDLLGYNSRDMEILLLDEALWDQLIDHFINARELWLERGFMYALQVLLVDLGVAERMLQSNSGEQRMTNLLQLAELLQIKAREIASHEELILWLKKQVDNSHPGDDTLLLRLESDEDLVQIVTMHKSKGLEYPVVFMPFPMALSTSGRQQNDVVLYHRRDDLKAVIDIGSESLDESIILRRQESLSEELRLFYVALTRSKCACVLYWGVARNINNSALKHLIHSDAGKLSYETIQSDLTQLVAASGGCIEMVEMVQNELVRFTDTEQSRKLTQPGYATNINRRWGMNSYTGLLRGKDADMPDHDELTDVTDDLPVESEVAASEEEQIIASLPAGARTGQLLHEIFEVMDFTDTTELDALIEKTMLFHGHLSVKAEDKEKDWAPVIKTIIENTLAASLDKSGELVLSGIASQDRLNEMEFFFSVGNLDPRSLQQTLAAYPQYDKAAVGLNFSAFEGLMQGFIDMVVRRDNRYFIVDYKSNWLGETRKHYDQSALKNSVNSHRYNLQYLIYTVALHRYLQKRLLDYDYDLHFGGVYYLFVRGMRPGSDSGVWFDKPPLSLINALDQLMQRSRIAA